MIDAKTAPTFTDDELKLIRRVAGAVWEELGYECLRALEDDARDRGKRGPVTMKRNDVIEVVADAGRMEDHLIRQGHKELAKKWSDAQYPEQVRTVLKPVFPYADYGI